MKNILNKFSDKFFGKEPTRPGTLLKCFYGRNNEGFRVMYVETKQCKHSAFEKIKHYEHCFLRPDGKIWSYLDQYEQFSIKNYKWMKEETLTA